MDPNSAVIIGFGLGVGILVGMTGIGGGSLMTPLLILVVGTPPVTAVGTDLAYGAVTKTVGGYKHWRQRTVDMKLSTWMAFGSVPAAIGGVVVLEILQDAIGSDLTPLLISVLAVVILLTGLVTLIRAIFLKQLVLKEREKLTLARRSKTAAVLIGAVVGFMLGVTSAGSGALIALALILVFRLVPQRVVGTDVFHAAVLLWAAGIAHIVAGNVDYALAGTILLGSVPGVWVGSHLSVRLPSGTLRTILGVVRIGAGLGLASKAGAPIPPYVIAGAPAIIGALVIYERFRDRVRREDADTEAPTSAAPIETTGFARR
ncbi:MAG: sulfite exporter TauE/SafE family protein [Thermoleophilaceae bacterium]